MDIRFRAVTQADEHFLWDMFYLAIYVPEGQPQPEREILHLPELSKYVEGWGKPGDEGFLAMDGEKPVGAAWIRLLTGENHGYGYVDEVTPELSIALVPEYRGKGIGKKLILHLIQNVKDHMPGICLSVTAENPAFQLYRRLGFTSIDQENDSIKMILRFLNSPRSLV